MPSKIRVLNEHTINKIAAGEVIENPSSVVKEMVENSLDAGATEITVEIQSGGRQLIRISDNGCGMTADDALLCLERHATSKIHNFEELENLATLGFRGEAIPSIAAISKLMIITNASSLNSENKNEATMVIVEGGKILKCTKAARSLGTTIEVKDLFYNVPVRKAFLKSPKHDTNEILKTMTSLSLGYPLVKFQLISDQKLLLSTPSTQGLNFIEALKLRVSSILGSSFLESTYYLDYQRNEYHLFGFVSFPTFNRHNKTGQYLLINNRLVVSPSIANAIRNGYGTFIPSLRYPLFVLHLELPKQYVDVNVHPQKREVRFRQERLLQEIIMDAVSSTLQKGGYGYSQGPLNLFTESINNTDEKNLFNENDAKDSTYLFQKKEFLLPIQGNSKPFSFNIQHEFNQSNFNLKSNFPDEKKPILQNLISQKNTILPRVIATIPNYIILDGIPFSERQSNTFNGLCLMDQRAAHSRILFDNLMQKKAINLKMPFISELQQLLVPITLELTFEEAKIVKEHLSQFLKFGLSIREFGITTFMIDAISIFYDKEEISGIISGLITAFKDSYIDDLNDQYQKEYEKKIANSAQRMSLAKDKCLNLFEAKMLVEALMQCQLPHHCPFGKPTMIMLSSKDLAKQFQRLSE